MGKAASGRFRPVFLILALGLILVFSAGWSSTWAAEGKPKVVVIGFDGADPKLVSKYRSLGLMPNLDRIAKEGTYSALDPTNPAQTPVSWASFATGLNPGRTEIFDFLQRVEGQYQPDFALATAGKRTFLLGERNGLLVGGLAGLVIGLVLIWLLRLVRIGWPVAGPVALVLALGAAVGLGVTFGRLLPVEMPAAKNNRKGTPFWTAAAQAGLKVKVAHVPVTFPAEELPRGSNMISGLGVPDMRGRIGSPSFFTSDPNFAAGKNEFSLTVTRLPSRRGVVETLVVGPFNLPFHKYVLERAQEDWKKQGLSKFDREKNALDLAKKLEAEGSPREINLPLRLTITDKELTYEVSGRTGSLKPGQWSDWVVFRFPVNGLIDRLQPLQGMGRFKLISLEPEVQLYLSTVNFHPSCHPVAYSWPPNFAEEMSGQVGLFKTIGWTIDTWSYPYNIGGIDLFIEDMWATVDQSEKIMRRLLDEPGTDVMVQIFDFTDRAGHMLWHELDDKHPLYLPEKAPRYQQTMEQVYRRMDQLIGEAEKMAGPEALFMVLSDHGFTSFRRQINYNTWLYKKGLLALKGQTQTRNLEQLFDKDVTGVDVFKGIDWSATRAWAMGLGSIYINLVGREGKGIVMPGPEYDKLVREIKAGLESEVDPETGLKPVAHVYHRDEIYHDYDPKKIPDLRAANIENYRMSWQDTLGGLSTKIFEDNDRLWSGDHCTVDPKLVQGILLINRKLTVKNPCITDMAPSILRELGLAVDPKLDGRVVWEPGRH